MHLLEHFETVHVIHEQVQQEQVGNFFPDQFQRLTARTAHTNPMALFLELVREDIAAALVVVDDQDVTGNEIDTFTLGGFKTVEY